jgi:hypothetical protein
MKLFCGAVLALFASAAFAQVTDFRLSRQAPSGSLSLQGDAAEDVGNWLLKLTSATGQTSGAWYPDKVSVATGFRFDMTFQIAPDPDAEFGLGDGMAVVLQSVGNNVLGGGGSDLGYGNGDLPGIAIEIDTYGFFGEFSTPHLSIQASNSALAADDDQSLGHIALDPSFINGKPHLMRVVYDANSHQLHVTFDPDSNNTPPTLTVPLNLADIDGASVLDENGAMYIGVTGGTGGAGELVNIDQMRFSSSGCESMGINEFDIPGPLTEGARAEIRLDGAGSAAVHYTWTLNGNVLSDGGRFGGTRTNKLVIDPVLPEDTGQLDFDGSNECSGVGTGFTLTVNPFCAADFNSDGFLDFTDFDDFVVVFEAGDASADFNGDEFLDFTDFDDFVTGFEGGC